MIFQNCRIKVLFYKYILIFLISTFIVLVKIFLLSFLLLFLLYFLLFCLLSSLLFFLLAIFELFNFSISKL